MFIGARVVQAILQLNESHRLDPEPAIDEFRQKRQDWEAQGGYLESVTVEDIATWVLSDSHIVVEASDPDALKNGSFVPVTQCVYQLPRNEWIIPQLAEPPDEIYNPELYDTIVRSGPQANALIDYLGVLPEWTNRGCAGAARYAGMLEVMRRNAALADADRIRHVVGLTFAIQGVVIPDLSETESDAALRLDRDFGQGEIVNCASMQAITTSRRCPSKVLGRWKDASMVPVTIDDRLYLLQVYWYCHVRGVSDVLKNVTTP